METNLQDNSYPKPKLKASLKLVAAPPVKLRLGGIAASEEMASGKYLIKCETAWMAQFGKTVTAVIQFSITDGKYAGVALRMWVSVSDGGGIISPTGRYARYCSIALGRPVTPDDPVDDPGQIFSGRFFIGLVGFRKTERPRGGKASDDLAHNRKDADDYLRVHDIISREDL